MDESQEQSGQGPEGALPPSAADAMPLYGPAPAPEAVPEARAVEQPLFGAPAAPAAQPAPAPSGPAAGHYDAPGSSDVSDALGVSDDGRPGGQTPSSSGFSWRVGGRPSPVMQSQGGIPNEFDHLFRDSDADGRRSLLPGQSPIGVSLPPAPHGGKQQAALPPASSAPSSQARAELNTAGDPQLPVYQPPAAPDSGYPQQPYAPQPYQQSSYQPTAEVPVGAPNGAAATGVLNSGDVDERHTQAIPRVPVQAHGTAAQPAGAGAGLLPADPRRTATPALLISVGVFIVLIVIAAVAFSGGGSSDKTKKDHPAAADTPASTADGVDPAAKAQADAIYALIGQSKGLTAQASNAIDDVAACKNVAAAQQTFTTIAQKRQDQADGVKALPADKIPGGAQLVADLTKAWQLSADSERELAGWAADNASCTGKPGMNDKRTQANSDAGKAGSTKITVVGEWNALAAKAGQPTIAKENL